MKVPLWKPSRLELEGISQGELTEEFERKMTEFLEVKYAVAVSSGTAALYLALKACGISVGDKVAVPDLTAIGTVNAIAMTGAFIEFLDVGDDNCLELDKVPLDCDAMVPVHFNGRACHGDWTMYDFVIEDACQALGSKVGSKFLGTIGTCGCFSFSPTKTIYTGQGGMVVTNHYWLCEKVKSLRDQGRIEKTERYICKSGNFKFTDLQAQIGLAQYNQIEALLKRKRMVYDAYVKHLVTKQLQGQLRMLYNNDGEVIWLPDIYTDNRERLHKHLLREGVITRMFYPPLHVQDPYFMKRDFPNAERISAQGLWLPAIVTEEEITYVCDKIKEFFA